MDLSVEIPISAWRSVAGDRSRLVTTLVVNGLPLHLEALVVSADEHGIQRGSREADEDLAMIHHAVGADRHWQTLEIDGREYVLIATPFC